MMAAGRRRYPSWLQGVEDRVGRRRVVLLAWSLWALAVLAMSGDLWLYHLGRQAGGLDARVVAVGLAAVSAATVGAVVASRRPNHPVGWLLLGFGLSVNAAGVAQAYAEYGLPDRTGVLPAARDVGVLPAARDVGLGFPAIVVTALALLSFVLLLTPTGSLPSPRWRWWARTTAAAPVVSLLAMLLASRPQPDQTIEGPFGLTSGVMLPVGFQLAFAVANLAVVAGSASLVVRFRRARGSERQQLRWVTLASVPMALGSVVAALAVVVALPQDAILSATVFLGLAVGIYFLPLAVGAAILRYRLYGLDYLISRTVVYGLLTAGGVAVYVAVVNGVERLLRAGGVGGSLLATAVIAVGFAPTRNRLQRWVDQRLYGDRHDPVRAMARLGARLRDAPGGAPGGDVLAGALQAVCETLRLPSASLRVDNDAEVASFGRPASASESIPLEHEGQRIGALQVGVRSGEDALGASDRRVLEILAAPVAVALHAVLLSQELQRSRERLVAAREEERRRLRRDLHDGLGPILTAVTLKADAARSTLATAPDRADGLLAELRGDAKQAIGDLRRVVEDLRPAALDELGLLGALSQQVDRFTRQGLSITLDAPPTLPVLPAAVEVAAFRIITEALTNIARHAHAHKVTITLAIDGDLCLEVHDDGTTSTASGDGWRPGTGLQSMNERVAEVGGTLQAGPTPTGGRVQASLPLELA
jgi:two-component system NarL family sensor kinase